jgi:hypothetical protein
MQVSATVEDVWKAQRLSYYERSEAIFTRKNEDFGAFIEFRKKKVT